MELPCLYVHDSVQYHWKNGLYEYSSHRQTCMYSNNNYTQTFKERCINSLELTHEKPVLPERNYSLPVNTAQVLMPRVFLRESVEEHIAKMANNKQSTGHIARYSSNCCNKGKHLAAPVCKAPCSQQ